MNSNHISFGTKNIFKHMENAYSFHCIKCNQNMSKCEKKKILFVNRNLSELFCVPLHLYYYFDRHKKFQVASPLNVD